MICKFCGNVIEDNSDFCFICGQKLAESEAEVPANEDVFAQNEAIDVASAAEVPAPAVAPAAVAEAPAVPQGAAIYATTAPVYAHQVFIQQIAPAPQGAQFVQVNGQNIHARDIASGGCKFFSCFFAITFILQFISWIWYKNAKKNGYDNKAETILNSTMIGLCIFMGIVIVALVAGFVI